MQSREQNTSTMCLRGVVLGRVCFVSLSNQFCFSFHSNSADCRRLPGYSQSSCVPCEGIALRIAYLNPHV